MIKAGAENCDPLVVRVQVAAEVVDEGAFQAVEGMTCQVVDNCVEERLVAVRGFCREQELFEGAFQQVH